jgi:nitrogen fixation negative regulator NifL
MNTPAPPLKTALIAAIVDAAPIALAVLDAEGQVILDNRAYRTLVADLGAAENTTPMAHQLLDWLNKDVHARFSAQELRLDAPGGKGPRWLSCSALPVFIPGEEEEAAPPHLLLAVSDISALRQEQEKARLVALRGLLAEEEHVEVVRESLSATLYQLEGPLNVMHSAIGMLKSREPAMSGALASALAEGRARLEELRQLIPSDKHEAVTPVNLNEVLRDVLDISIPRLLANGITINWRPVSTLPTVLGRPLQLHVLFKALVDNAIEAVSQRGCTRRDIALSTIHTGQYVQIAIDDRGAGIAAELRLKAFEPFFTTWGNSRQQHLGTGLSRALQVVIAHNGTLELQDAPEGGCRAWVEFPLEGSANIPGDFQE